MIPARNQRNKQQINKCSYNDRCSKQSCQKSRITGHKSRRRINKRATRTKFTDQQGQGTRRKQASAKTQRGGTMTTP